MKIFTQKKIVASISIYNLIGVTILLFVNSYAGLTQQISKTLEIEIPVSKSVKIITKGPQSFRVTGVGVINARQIGNRYIVSGKKSTPYIYVIHKTLEINCWSKQRIKQVANIKVETKNKDAAEELLANLKFNLRENASESVMIDCALNIDKFNVHNSWFGEDKNSVKLDNGTSYEVKYLEIKTILFIPADSKLTLETFHTDVTLMGHQGSIDLKMKRGSLKADTLHTLYGISESAHINASYFHSMKLNLKDSYLNLLRGGNLSIESSLSTIDISKLDQLVIQNSLNDHYIINDVDEVVVDNSFVTDFKISNVERALQMDTKHATVSIDNLGQNFEKAEINNSHGDISIDTKHLNNYKLTIRHPDKSNYGQSILNNLVSKNNAQAVYQYGLPTSNVTIDIDCNQCNVKVKPFQ